MSTKGLVDGFTRSLSLAVLTSIVGPNPEILTQIALIVQEGKARPVVGAGFALGFFDEVRKFSETGHSVGKIVLYSGNP